MDVLTYIEQEKMTFAELAAKVGIRTPSLHMIAHGKRGWSPEIGDAIVRASGGKITLDAMTKVRLAHLEKYGPRVDAPPQESAA